MESLISDYNFLTIFIIFAVALFGLSRSADFLVDNAVKIARNFNMPNVIIGATIVAIGTTIPELATAVISVLNDTTDLALSNTIGSVITNTTLILGIGTLFGSIPVTKTESTSFNGFATVLIVLIASCYLMFAITGHGQLPQWFGVFIILLLPIYMLYTFIQAESTVGEEEKVVINLPITFLKIAIAAVLIALFADGLVATVKISAERFNIPTAVIGATVVAFGTSAPEISIIISSVKKKQGGLAIGNIFGANILNIIFGIGITTIMSKGNVTIGPIYYQYFFPIILIIILIFGLLIHNSKKHQITKREGYLLFVIYAVFLIITLTKL